MHAADEITSAARQLLADAVAAGGAGPAVAAPEPAVPTSPGMPAMPTTTGMPAMSLPAAAPATDSSGIRGFVSRIRGLNHLSLPPLQFGVPAPRGPGLIDVDAVRRDFPILRERVHGKPLAWLDNAATTQKPQAVTDAIARFYAHDNSNIHRGAHTLAARATDAYEHSRQTVATFLGANSPDEILFVRGCTEGVNLVANVLAPGLSRGDEIVLTELEHHANIVPWQMVAERTGAVIRVAPIDDHLPGHDEIGRAHV